MELIDLPIGTITKCNDIEFKVVKDNEVNSCTNCVFDIGGALESVSCDGVPYTCIDYERDDSTSVKFVEC